MTCPPLCPASVGAVGGGGGALLLGLGGLGSVSVGAAATVMIPVAIGAGLAGWAALPVRPVAAQNQHGGVAADATAVAPGSGASPRGGEKAERRAILTILLGGTIISAPNATPDGGDQTQTGAGGRSEPAQVEPPASAPNRTGEDKRKKREP